MLDLVSPILLSEETLKPKAFPRWPLFMKFPRARTTSRSCCRLRLCRISLEALVRAGGQRSEVREALDAAEVLDKV